VTTKAYFITKHKQSLINNRPVTRH